MSSWRGAGPNGSLGLWEDNIAQHPRRQRAKVGPGAPFLPYALSDVKGVYMEVKLRSCG